MDNHRSNLSYFNRVLIFGLLLSTMGCVKSANTEDDLEIKVSTDTYWWAGVINHGNKMPLQSPYQANFNSNYGNQVQPLMLSSKGEVVWSDQPYGLDFIPGRLKIQGSVEYTQRKGTLRDAYLYASQNYFPPSGKMPDPLLFTHPQYNTWIELMYDQNQQDILAYAKNIIANDLPPGVLMIDDNWQEDYGKWNFHPGRFAEPGKMIAELHDMGFKVMVWVCPFVSPDCDVYRELMDKQYLVKDSAGAPAIVRWWNGASALLDLSNPGAFHWFQSQLNHLMDEYGVDGFKLDAGDFEYYEGVHSYMEDATPQDHSELFGKIGLSYPLNEYRAMWKMGGQPLAERLRDKGHSFEALQLLIPNMLTAGLMGYYFSCPDMIGGGEFTAFLDDAVLDQELIVRSAQCHALMPMMQFSVAPWRVLDVSHYSAVKISVSIREKFQDYILQTAITAAETGEPIMRPLEYAYPDQGFADVIDQFLIGDKLLVAPVVEKGATLRKVVIPDGQWKGSKGQVFTGPGTIEMKVSLDDLPYFELIE
jgi:alpha-glucosidase (family GH31 glycosyl hydrolase)